MKTNLYININQIQFCENKKGCVCNGKTGFKF